MTVRLLHYSDVENAFDDPDRIARLVETVRERRDGSTVVCGTGDTIAPGVLSMETDAEHVHPFYDAIDPDFETFGNHDFDRGLDPLRAVVADSPQTWVSTNLRGPDGDVLGADQGARRTAIASVGDRRIGFLGVTQPDVVRDHGRATDVTAVDPVPAAADAISNLRAAGVDDVVVLSHLGRGDRRLAAAVDADVILGGHVHRATATTVEGTTLTRTGARGRRLAEVSVDGDWTPRLLDVTDRDVTEDIRERYRRLFADAGLNERVAEVDRPLDRGPAACLPESRVGNLVVDAYRWVADAEVAICNAGMLRAGPTITGSVTTGDLRSLTPFENDIWSARLTGDELLTLFRNLTAPAVGIDEPELFAHVSGAKLRWRRNGTLDLVGATVGGTPVDRSREYRVAAPTFGFLSDVFAPLSRERRVDTHGSQHDALAEYVEEFGVPDRVEGRATAVFDGTPETTRSL